MATPITVWIKNNQLFLTDPDAVVPAPAPAPVPAGARVQHRGANLTGASTSYTTWGSAGPVKGTHYQFVSHAEVDLLIAAGLKTFRLLFAWEAIQPTEYANIATLSGNFALYRDALYEVVAYVRSKGAEILLDIHGDMDAGFAAYRGTKVGQTSASGQKAEDMLANLWGQIATRFGADAGVMYGVTNEPHDIAPAVWYGAAQKVINAIRAAGSTSKIVMPGVDWTGAGSWMSQNAAAWNLTDPAKNLAVQVHLYLDTNSGGGSNEIVNDSIAVTRLTNMVAWARGKGLEVWIAEIAFSASNPIAVATWTKTLAFINANKDVIAGFEWWAAGPASWWGGYAFTLIGSDGKASAQLRMLLAAGSFT